MPKSLFSKGDLVWYRDRHGVQCPGKVLSVDLAIDPPSFGVQLDATGAIRETEAPRLQLRRPEDAASPVQQPQPTVASASTAATVSSPAPVLANGGGDDDWGAFEGDDAAPAAMPAHAPAHQHANGFASASPAAPFQSASGWSGFGAGPAPFQPAKSWGGGAAPVVAAVLSTDEAGHRRGVSADRALPEDLFSEPAQPASSAAVADGPADQAEDDDFGDFADAEPVAPVPAQQPAEQPAQQPGMGWLSTDWQATGSQQHPLPGMAPADTQQLPDSASMSAGRADALAAWPAPPNQLSALPALQFSSSAGHSTAAPSSAVPARTVQPSEAAPAADVADDGFADFGAFADAEPADGGNGDAAAQPPDALWHSSPPQPSPAPGPAAAPSFVLAEAHSTAVSLPTAVEPSAPVEPAAAAAGGDFSGWASQTAGAEAAEHRRGVSRDQALPEDLFSEDTADPGEDETGPAETASELAGAAQTEAAKGGMPSPGLRSPQHSLHSPSSVASAAAAWVAALAASPEDEGDPPEPDEFGDFSDSFAPPPLADMATAVPSPAHPAASPIIRAKTPNHYAVPHMLTASAPTAAVEARPVGGIMFTLPPPQRRAMSAALAEDDFADFASAASEAPVSPATAPQNQPVSDDLFAATLPVAQHGANGGSAADGEPSDAAYAVISAAAEAREHRAHAAADDDLFGGGQLEGSVQSGAVITVEPLVSTTATQQQAEDLFAAFSPTNAAKARTEFDDWGAEEGFGAFSTVAAGNNVAAELAAAGVAVSSPKRVTRDWSAPIEMGLFGDAEAEAEEDGFADAFQDDALQQAEPAIAKGDGDDFGDWADTDADAATVGGVPPALAPYLRAWTLLLKACALEMEACRAAWRGLAELPSEAREDPRAVAFLAGVGEVLVAAAIVRATVRAHQVDMADADFFEAARSCDLVWRSESGLQDAIVAAHAAWSRQASATDGSTAPASEEGLCGEDFTLVDGLDEDEPAAEPAVTAAPAEALSLAEALDRPAAVAESLLFPFDGGVRPMAPAFAPSNSGDTAGAAEEVCALSRLPLAALASIPGVDCEGRLFLAPVARMWTARVMPEPPQGLL